MGLSCRGANIFVPREATNRRRSVGDEHGNEGDSLPKTIIRAMSDRKGPSRRRSHSGNGGGTFNSIGFQLTQAYLETRKPRHLAMSCMS